MGDWSGLLGSAAVLVALVSAAVVGLQSGRLTNLRGQLKDERDEAASLRIRIEERDDTIVDKDKKLAEKDERITDLETVVRIATGEAQSQAILDLLEHHHRDATQRWGETSDLLLQMLAILAKERRS